MNLADVTLLDLVALRALLGARCALEAQGRRLVVDEPTRAATRVFELTGLLGVSQPANEPK